MTLTSDAATIAKVPLTNYIGKYPGEPGLLLKYDDATEFYKEPGAIKDAQHVSYGIREVVEEVGPSNVAAIVTDCAPVMVAAWILLNIHYPFIFIFGCVAHQVNTFVKHVIKKHGIVQDLIDKNKAIVHHFDSLHRPHAHTPWSILKKHSSLLFLLTLDLVYIF